MYISDFAIKRPMVTITAMLALVVFGLFALFQLDTDEFPDVQPPVITTSIVYPGASPMSWSARSPTRSRRASPASRA